MAMKAPRSSLGRKGTVDVEKRLATAARVVDAQMSKVNFDHLYARIMAAADALDNSNDPTSNQDRARPGR